MGFRRNLVIRFAKWASNMSQKIRGGQGVTLPGYIARKLDHNILTSLNNDVRKKTFVVLGTNGKTTTNSILYNALAAEGEKVIINKTGSNMMNGVTSAYVLATDKKGRLDADYACIEVDELASLTVLPEIRPDYLILTNIYRDQLDRFGEVDITFQKLKEAIRKTPNTVLLINGDDVLSYTLAKESGNEFHVYGINEQIFDDTSRSEIRESIFCRQCGHKLEYKFFHYGQLGDYSCPNCGLTRPVAEYSASQIQLSDSGSTFTVGDRSFTTGAKAPYNIYNTMAAYAALRMAGLEASHFEQMIAAYDYGNSRESQFDIAGTHLQIHLAKNPVGFQQKVSFVLRDDKPKDIIILINDEAQDGKDVSWLWDVDFQYLANANANSIIAAGKRGYDMQLRLKYEDIPCEVTQNLKETICDCIDHRSDNLYVIVNYTGLYSTNALLENLAKEYAGKEGQS